MNYKTLAEDALDVAKRSTLPSIAADHLARANVYALMHLAEQQNMSNRMQYAIDFATGDEHYAELGREIGAALGVAT